MNIRKNKSTYNKIFAEIRPFIRSAQSLYDSYVIKQVIEDQRNMRSGSLDTTKFVDAMCNKPNVFKRKIVKRNKIKRDEYAIVLILDLSRSMLGKKAKFVQKLTILLYNVFSKIKDIDLFIYGHNNNLYCFLDNKSCHDINQKYTLGSIEEYIDGMNYDGAAYYKIICDAASMTNKKIIPISITDSLYWFDIKTMKDFLCKMTNVFNMTSLCNITLIDNNPNSYMIENNNFLFGNGNYILYNINDKIKTSTVNDITKQLAKIIKTLKNEKRK